MKEIRNMLHWSRWHLWHASRLVNADEPDVSHEGKIFVNMETPELPAVCGALEMKVSGSDTKAALWQTVHPMK